MKLTNSRFVFLALFAILIFVILFYGFDRMRRCYAVVFHKSGMIADYNGKGQINGEAYTYREGQLIRKSVFKNGLFDGWTIEYYPSGAVKDSAFYSNNQVDGTELGFYESGKIKNRILYKSGQQQGESIRYYENGKVENRSLYKNSRLDGKEMEYYPNGNLKYSRFWRNNKPVGDFYDYYENKHVKGYHTFDITGQKFYLVRYGQNGSVLKRDGYAFSNNLYYIDSDSVIILKDNGKYKSIKDLYLTVSIPPDQTTSFKLTVNGRIIKDFNIDGNAVQFPNVFSNAGDFDITAEGILVDQSTHAVTSETLKLRVIKE